MTAGLAAGPSAKPWRRSKQVFLIAVVAISALAAVFVGRQWWLSRGYPEQLMLQQRSITANPTENPVYAAAISCDARAGVGERAVTVTMTQSSSSQARLRKATLYGVQSVVGDPAWPFAVFSEGERLKSNRSSQRVGKLIAVCEVQAFVINRQEAALDQRQQRRVIADAVRHVARFRERGNSNEWKAWAQLIEIGTLQRIRTSWIGSECRAEQFRIHNAGINNAE